MRTGTDRRASMSAYTVAYIRDILQPLTPSIGLPGSNDTQVGSYMAIDEVLFYRQTWLLTTGLAQPPLDAL